MKIIFINPKFPGRFSPILEALGKHKTNQILFITEKAPPIDDLKHVETIPYKNEPTLGPFASKAVENYALAHAAGKGVSKVLATLKNRGFTPDLIIGQSGHGITFYVKDVFPKTSFLCYFDRYANPDLIKADFDPDTVPTLSSRMELRDQNLPVLTDLIACDHGICQSLWQKSQIPEPFHDKISIVHDGIDTAFFNPGEKQKITLSGITLSDDEELITYTSSILAPYKGFSQFLASLPQVLEKRPNAKVLIAGTDRIIFRTTGSDSKSYKQLIFEKIKPNPDRVYFVESLTMEEYRQVLLASSVHVYLGVAYAVSKPMLEAMACECLVIAPDSSPVKEVIRDGSNGILLDFKDSKDIAQKMIACLEFPSFMEKLRQKARQTIEKRYALENELPKLLKLIRKIEKPADNSRLFG